MALIVPMTTLPVNQIVDGTVVEIPGTFYPNAYAKVLVSRAHSDLSYICVSWYADEAARLANADPVTLTDYVVQTSSLKGDYYPAIYAYLKTLPEFEGATDHPMVDPDEAINQPVEPTPEPTQAEAQA